MIAALLAVVSITPPRARGVQAAVLAFYLVFAVLRLNPGYIWDLGREFRPYVADARLDFGRAGLVVPRGGPGSHRRGVVPGGRDVAGAVHVCGPRRAGNLFHGGAEEPDARHSRVQQRVPDTGLPLPVLLEDNGVTSIVINQQPSVFRATRTSD